MSDQSPAWSRDGQLVKHNCGGVVDGLTLECGGCGEFIPWELYQELTADEGIEVTPGAEGFDAQLAALEAEMTGMMMNGLPGVPPAATERRDPIGGRRAAFVTAADERGFEIDVRGDANDGEV